MALPPVAQHLQLSLEYNNFMEEKDDCFKTKIFDEAIFSRYESIKVSVLSDVKPDSNSLTKIKEQFLNGTISAPVLTYSKNKKINYDEPEVLLHDLELEIKSSIVLPEIIREQYLLVVSEKLLKIKMLRQTQALALVSEPILPMQSFQKYSELLYGALDEQIFYNVMQTVERDIKRRVEHSTLDKDKTESSERLLQLIDGYSHIRPAYQRLVVTPLVVVKKPHSITDAQVLKEVFEKGLQDYKIEDDWKVVIDKRGTRSSISVSYGLQKIYLPCTAQLQKRSKRKKLTPQRIQGLIAHEIGTHVKRNANGKRSCLKLLGSGLCKYEQGEEGLATYREQCAQSLSGYAGLEAYFSIGLAKGLDGWPPRDFAQVHAILSDYYFVVENTAMEHAKELAWNRCVRIFRGTSGTVPGVVFTKDLIYRHGNIKHWEAVKNGTLANVDIDGGKFDPTNNQHVTFLQKLSEL